MNLIEDTSTRRRRTPETWARAKADYLAGLGAPEICERYDLGLTAFRDRAKAEGWRRADLGDPEPADHSLNEIAYASPADLKEKTYQRMLQAVDQGRAREAQSWHRLYKAYAEMAAYARGAFDGHRHAPEAAPATAPAYRASLYPDWSVRAEPDSPDSPDAFFPGAAQAEPAEPPPAPNRAARKRAEALARRRR